MTVSRSTDGSLMVEWNRQTSQNLNSMELYERLFETAEGTVLSKLDNFARHVRRQSLSKFMARAEIYKSILNVHGSILDLEIGRAHV